MSLESADPTQHSPTLLHELRIQELTQQLQDPALSEAQRFALKKKIAAERAALLKEQRHPHAPVANDPAQEKPSS
jgi:hypothetical protein